MAAACFCQVSFGPGASVICNTRMTDGWKDRASTGAADQTHSPAKPRARADTTHSGL